MYKDCCKVTKAYDKSYCGSAATMFFIVYTFLFQFFYKLLKSNNHKQSVNKL